MENRNSMSMRRIMVSLLIWMAGSGRVCGGDVVGERERYTYELVIRHDGRKEEKIEEKTGLLYVYVNGNPFLVSRYPFFGGVRKLLDGMVKKGRNDIRLVGEKGWVMEVKVNELERGGGRKEIVRKRVVIGRRDVVEFESKQERNPVIFCADFGKMKMEEDEIKRGVIRMLQEVYRHLRKHDVGVYQEKEKKMYRYMWRFMTMEISWDKIERCLEGASEMMGRGDVVVEAVDWDKVKVLVGRNIVLVYSGAFDKKEYFTGGEVELFVCRGGKSKEAGRFYYGATRYAYIKGEWIPWGF